MISAPEGFTPLRLGAVLVGAVSQAWQPLLLQTAQQVAMSWAQQDVAEPAHAGASDDGYVQLAELPTRLPVLRWDGHGLRLAERLPVSALELRLQQMALLLRAAGELPGWRDEQVAVDLEDNLHPGGESFRIERAMLRPLGLVLPSVMVNVWTVDAQNRPCLWVARRSLTKPVDPGKLDTLVGGGIAADETVQRTLLRECEEEAGIPVFHSSQAQRVGISKSMHVQVDQGRPVLHRERIHAFDLKLPREFEPTPADGEHQWIGLMTPGEVRASLESGDWSDEGAELTRSWLRRVARHQV